MSRRSSQVEGSEEEEDQNQNQPQEEHTYLLTGDHPASPEPQELKSQTSQAQAKQVSGERQDRSNDNQPQGSAMASSPTETLAVPSGVPIPPRNEPVKADPKRHGQAAPNSSENKEKTAAGTKIALHPRPTPPSPEHKKKRCPCSIL